MIKYIVFWILTFTVPAPCDIPPYDAYGRPNASTCLVYHCEVKKESNSRVFSTLEEAQYFVREGEKQDGLSDFEIKEMKDIGKL